MVAFLLLMVNNCKNMHYDICSRIGCARGNKMSWSCWSRTTINI